PGRGAARLLLPRVVLTLEQISVFRGGDELLRLAARVAVVRLRASGHRDHRAVMKIVVPERVETITALVERPNPTGLLWFVLCNEQDGSPRRRVTCPACDGGQDVLVGIVEDLLRRIETQAVEVKFVNPVPGVGDEKLPHGRGGAAVEIDRV